MPLENYSVENISTILQAFGLQNKPFSETSGPGDSQNPRRAIYFQTIANPIEINLMQDTLDYLHALVHCRRLPHTERYVIYLWQTISTQKYAILIKYQNPDMDNLKKFIRERQSSHQSDFTGLTTVANPPLLCHFYQNICIKGFMPAEEGITDITPTLQGFLNQQIRKNITLEETECCESTSIRLTYSILSHLCFQSMPVKDLSLEELYDQQRNKVTAALLHWLQQLKENHLENYEKLRDQLIILIKYTQLQAYERSLAPLLQAGTTSRATCLQQHTEHQKHFFSLTFKKDEKLLSQLSLTGLCRILKLHENLGPLFSELEQQRLAQYTAILNWESTVPPYEPPSLSRPQLLQQKALMMGNYFYARSEASLGKTLFSRFVQELLPNHRLWNIAAPVIGFILGVLYLWTFSIFELAVKFALLFLVEKSFSFLNKETIRLEKAIVTADYPTLTQDKIMFFYLALLFAAMSLYTQNTFYLKQSLFVLSFATASRYLFLKETNRRDAFEDKPQDRFILSFLVSQLGLAVGNFLFFTYANMSNKLNSLEKAIPQLKEAIKEHDPTINYYSEVEYESLLPRPWRWFNRDNPFRFRLGNDVSTYQLNCNAISDSISSDTGEVSCEVTPLPKMLRPSDP